MLVSRTTAPSNSCAKAKPVGGLENHGVIKNGRFVCDYEFRSASEAAAVVRGCSSNGKDEWRIRVDGKEMKMKDILNQ